MPDQRMPSIADSTGSSSGKSPYSVPDSQPVWMAHWMQPSSIATGKKRDRGIDELDCSSRSNSTKDGSKDSRPVKDSRVVEAKAFKFISSKVEDSESALWPPMKHGQISDDKQAKGQVLGRSIEQDRSTDLKGGTQSPRGEIPAVVGTSSKRCYSAGEDTSKSLPEWMKTHSTSMDRSITVLKPFQGSTMESSTQIVPYYNLKKSEFDKGKAPLIMKPSYVSKDQFPNSNMGIPEQEHCNKHGQLTDFFSERKINSHSDTAMDVHLGDINTSLLLDTPSSSQPHLPVSGQAWFQKRAEEIESKKLCCNHCSLQKLPYCVHDMKTMRICTTVDSVEASREGFPKYSQTTHHVFITKGGDLSGQNDVFRTTGLVAEINGNTSSDFHIPSAFYGQAKGGGVELRSLSGSSNSKGKRTIEDVAASKSFIKNESSAETDTMDIDVFKEEISNAGANHTFSNKGFIFGSPLSPRINGTSHGEATHHWNKAIRPDINLELPALPADACSSENMCAGSSRTQSLDTDANILLAHSNHPNKKSNLSPGDSSEVDPTMRWVKRLKLTLPNSTSQATPTSYLGKSTNPIGMKNHFKVILEGDIARSGPTPKSDQVKETVASDKTQGMFKASEDFMPDSATGGKESLLSQAWIKRWLRNGSKVAQNKAATVVCKPQSFKKSLDDFQKKQFPSIAAMALMGKAMKGLHTCELHKQESFTIWNTKAFLKEI
ncbi:uncharacterized protein LOC127260933 [Andrographis paniculata]|uniref:uncharacterized protein LOC127260933 n=1 Tax=Andrographis paniculata TaxID=175694 RepID=UPI0021E9137C|nr:uncharacterized protein LOC127260933 [Andrographis paniculata]